MGSNSSNLGQQASSVTIIVQPIHFILSILTNSFNIFILTRRRLYSLPCTHYFLAYSIFSIIYTCFSCSLQILRLYGILWTNTSVGCRLQTFIVQTTSLLANLMILLATIDRFCSSSRSIKLRSLSNRKFTRWLIIISILIYVIYMSPTIAINYWWQNTCLQYSNTFVTIYLLSQIIVYYFITLSFTGIFSFLTWLNIRQQINQIAPFVHTNRAQRIEKQLFSPTIYSIELINRPRIVQPGQTVQLTSIIQSSQSGFHHLRFQIIDTQDFLIETDLNFTNQTVQIQTMTFTSNLTINLITFSVSRFDNRTGNYVVENDETASIYLDIDSSTQTFPISNKLVLFIIVFLFFKT